MNGLEYLVLLAVSFLANLFSAYSGGGAGLIQLPALIFLGLPFAVALATHKVASVALGVGATLRHIREGGLERHLSLHMLATGLPGVLAGAALVLHVPARVAEVSLGVLTVALGLYSGFSPRLGQRYLPVHRDLRGYALGGVGLFAIGLANGALSSGTGLFATLWLVRWFGLDYRRAVAHTLVIVGLFWNGTGALVLGTLGDIRWTWLPALLIGSLLGGYAGAHLAIATGNRWIKRAYEVVTLLVGAKLILG